MNSSSLLWGGIGGAVLFLLLTAWNANAADSSIITVQDLYQDCKNAGPNSDPLNSGLCLGYISGVGDALTVLGTKAETRAYGICGNISYGAALQAFNNWAAAYPEEWNKGRLIGVTYALRQLWPCDKAAK